MADEVDPQSSKRAAAAAYDYDGDPRWAEYWSNVLIPPNLASRPDVIDHYKRKFYQRFIDPDFVVETMSSSSSSQSGRASGGSSSSPATETARSHNPGPNAAARSAPQNMAPVRLDRQTIYFSLNAWVLVMALIGIFLFVSPNLAQKAYRLSLLGTGCSSLCSLYAFYGKPRAWTLPAIQSWLHSIFPTKDFICFLYCLILVTSRMHFKFALIPVICRPLEYSAKFLRRNFVYSSLYRRYLEWPCFWIEAHTNTLNFMTTKAEIGVGFLLIMSLFSWQRNVLHTFMYWQLLKLMYHVPVTASYHRNVWARIGQVVNPFILHHAPFLRTPISAVQRWWFR
ncbi:transmembrane protein 33 homolog [Dioscorea cayenensis subsp. rotundata]|uniref:Transmembrane protein 33 homolog n=1 Tax=Dioscorea cayennensis subsp. rotundata TaxID=55577 RepID=A0AB40BG16_DIOCR|nr:transmembrane protein 33 homolog [Dioscorea cayenensis subsp. rotundata]